MKIDHTKAGIRIRWGTKRVPGLITEGKNSTAIKTYHPHYRRSMPAAVVWTAQDWMQSSNHFLFFASGLYILFVFCFEVAHAGCQPTG